MRRKPTSNEWVVIGGAILWLVAYFLPWYHTTAPGLSLPIAGNVAGGLRWALFVVAFLVLVFAVVVSFDLVEVDLPASNGLVLLVSGAFLSVSTLVYAVWTPTGSSFSYGVWLSLLGGLCITYGGYASHSTYAPVATSRPDMRWTPQPPAPGTDPAHRSQVPPQRPPASTPPRAPQPKAPPASYPPAPQQGQPGAPQQPIPPGYPHGQGQGYGGGQGEGW